MIRRHSPTLFLLLLVVLLGWKGGGAFPLDSQLVQGFVGWRARHPDMSDWLVRITHLGGGPVLLTLAGLTAALLAIRNRAAALGLMLSVLGGRLLIEVVKLAVDRPRPGFDAHPVWVYSQSFPSGHAGNTMITFGAIALFALPGRWRAPGLLIAVLLSLLVGATRPMLGVHWPSDVLGGWLLGGAWLFLTWSLWLAFRRERA